MHPLNVLEFREKEFFYSPYESQIDFILRTVPPRTIKNIYSNLPPHVFMRVNNFESCRGKVVDVIGVMCPMFPEEIIFSKERALKKVAHSVQYAIKQGANFIVLAGFTSIIGNQGQEVKKRLGRYANVVITSGNTLTAALCLKGIRNALRVMNRASMGVTTIVGATGDIGSVCAKMLASKSKKIILCSRNIDLNSQLYIDIKEKYNPNVFVEKDIKTAVADADVVLIATSSFIPLIDLRDIKSNTILCDVSLPYNISMDRNEKRSDIFVFDGGKAKLSKDKNINLKKWAAFTNNYESIPGCLAEGLLLGLEDEKVDFSIGRGNISEEKINLIFKMAESHGIDVSDFAFHEKKYSSSELTTICKAFVV